ncbi:hypothetical protein BJ944DRAFT_246058 [Cunninghamella echinulata]|nr:hypothetical protein BJ944DRAFT_246058 [Cunninghamella echinulata]
MTEDKKRKQIDEINADIFKTDKKDGYSQLSYEKVLEYLGIDDITLFSEKGNIPMKEIDEETIEDISKNLIKLTRAYGVADQGNESKRQKFVDVVIYNIVAKYFDKKVKLKSEEPIDGEDVKGPVEFVIVRGKLILIAIEAKKQDWDQGRAQLFMQLYNAYISNIKLGASKDHIVYGFVTTGYSWEFIWCKGNNINDTGDIKSNITWKYEEKFNPIETSLKKTQPQWQERVTPLVEKLNYVIDYSLNQFNELSN